MKHDEFDALIATALANGLEGDELDAFEAHKRDCPACAESLALAAEFETSVASIASPARAPADIEDRLVAAFRAAAPKPKFSLTMTAVKVPGWLWKGAAGLAAAAGLVMIGNYAEPDARHTDEVVVAAHTPSKPPQAGWRAEAPSFALEPGDNPDTRTDATVDDVERVAKRVTESSNLGSSLMRENLAGNMMDRTKDTSLRDYNVQLGRANVVADPEQDLALNYTSSSAAPGFGNANQPKVDKFRNFGDFKETTQDGRNVAMLAVNPDAAWAKEVDDVATLKNPVQSSEATVNLLRTELERTRAAIDAEARAHEVIIERLFADKSNVPAIRTIPTVIGGTTTTAPTNPTPSRPKQEQPAAARKVIRNATLEFEVDVYISAYKRVNDVARECGGYLAGENTRKLPNGKVCGEVTIRIPAENFDRAVDMLRALGDLRNQSVSANDVTKTYVDLEGRIKTARAMEERLLAILKDPKGETKDILQVEKELATVRGQIEQMLGEIKYMENQVALSTIILSLAERDLATPFEYVETQVAAIDVVAADLEAAFAEAHAIAKELGGRVQEAKLNRPQAGAASATMKLQIDSDKFHEAVARLKKLGVVLVAATDLRTVAAGGNQPSKDAKVRREAGLIDLVISGPREATTGRGNLVVTSKDVEKIYDDARKLVEAAGELKDAKLVRTSTGSTGTIVARVPTEKFLAIITQIKALGDILDESVDTVEAALRSPTGEPIPLKGYADLTITLSPPRDAITAKAALAITSDKVDDDYAKAKKLVEEAKGEIQDAQLVQGQSGSIAAKVTRDAFRKLVDDLKALGMHVDATVNAAEGGLKRPTGEALPVKEMGEIKLTLGRPREVVSAKADVRVEAANVDAQYNNARTLIEKAGGEIQDAQLLRQTSGATGTIIAKVKREDFGRVVDALKALGEVKDIAVNAVEGGLRGPNGEKLPVREFGTFRFVVVSPRELVESGSFQRTMSQSLGGVMWSLEKLMVGLGYVAVWIVPLALVLWFARRRRKAAAPAGKP